MILHPDRTALRVTQLERLELRLLMHANPVLDAEHAAVMALVPDSAATYKSVNNGNWSDPGNWSHLVGGDWLSDGTIPDNGANVVISAGDVVTIDGDLSKGAGGGRVALHTIRDDGTLNFNTHVNTQLLVDTVIVTAQGRFEMGTAASPIDPNVKAKVVFADSGDIDLSWDPLQFSRGMVSHGQVSIFGAASKVSSASIRAREDLDHQPRQPSGGMEGRRPADRHRRHRRERQRR